MVGREQSVSGKTEIVLTKVCLASPIWSEKSIPFLLKSTLHNLLQNSVGYIILHNKLIIFSFLSSSMRRRVSFACEFFFPKDGNKKRPLRSSGMNDLAETALPAL